MFFECPALISKLEQLAPNATVRGIPPDGNVNRIDALFPIERDINGKPPPRAGARSQ
jgi:hypothetical protein